MCLRLVREPEEHERSRKVFYKVFQEWRSRHTNELRLTGTNYPIAWCVRNVEAFPIAKCAYKLGYHAFTSLAGARAWARSRAEHIYAVTGEVKDAGEQAGYPAGYPAVTLSTMRVLYRVE